MKALFAFLGLYPILNDRWLHDFPLMWYAAIGKPKPGVAELFLKEGADVNMRSVSSFMPGTPLEIAKRRNNSKVADVLIKYGAK